MPQAKTLTPAEIDRVLAYIDMVADADNRISVDDFCAMARKYPAALYPAIQLRDRMRQAFFGARWWQRRLQLFQDARRRLQQRKVW